MRVSDTVADLLGSIQVLPPDDLAELLDALAGMPCVEAAGWRIRERRLCVERFPARNTAIRAARDRGLSYGFIAKQFGITREAVIKII